MSTRRAHRWIKEACTRCGLRRREAWVVDGLGRSVMALVWTDASGDRQIQPLPPFKGIEPPEGPVLPVSEAFPGLPIGPEPPCDRSARARAAKDLRAAAGGRLSAAPSPRTPAPRV